MPKDIEMKMEEQSLDQLKQQEMERLADKLVNSQLARANRAYELQRKKNPAAKKANFNKDNARKTILNSPLFKDTTANMSADELKELAGKDIVAVGKWWDNTQAESAKKFKEEQPVKKEEPQPNVGNPQEDRKNDPMYKNSLLDSLSGKLNIDKHQRHYLAQKPLEELEKINNGSPEDLKAYWDVEKEKLAVKDEKLKEARKKAIEDRKINELSEALYKVEHADELKEKREKSLEASKLRREKNLKLREERERQEQLEQEKERLGEDEATKELVGQFKEEDAKAREQMGQEKKSHDLAGNLQNEEIEKAKIDKLFGEGAYEESKKVQAEKEKFEKVFGEGTFTPYKEEQAKKEKTDKLFGKGAYEESKKVQAEKEKFEKVFGEGTFIPYKEEQAKKQQEQKAADAKPVDAMPFANALEGAVLGYHGSALGTDKLRDNVANFLRQHRLLGTDKKATELSMPAGELKKNFKGFAQEADGLLKKVGKEPNIPRGFMSSVEMAQDVQVLNQITQRGIDPEGLEGKKMMLAAKIAFGGGRSFTDSKDFLCNSEKFMKTVDLVMKTRSFQDFTKGKSPEEIGKMATFDTDALYQDFNARLTASKEKKLETGQKRLPTEQKKLPTEQKKLPTEQKKPQQIAGKKKNQIEQVANMFSESGVVSKEQGMTMAKQLKELMQGGGSSEEIMKKMMNKSPEFKDVLKAQVKAAKEKKKQETPKKLTQEPLKKAKKKETAMGI